MNIDVRFRPGASITGQNRQGLKLFRMCLCFAGEFLFLPMLVQQIILILIFLTAVAYLGSIIYKSFQAKSGCASGCGKCGAIDFAKIEKQIK